jgi:Cellulose binding domain
VTITNTGTSAIDAWTLQFTFGAKITQIWNAAVESHSGKRYVLQNAGYNSTIAPGQSVSFGFLGKPGGAPAAPASYFVNGTPVGTAKVPLANARKREERLHAKRRHNRHRA